MLTIDALTYRIAGREILTGASARLPAGRRIGLVGRNGAGKSTLFKLIQGQLHGDSGTISLPAGWRLGGVAQEVPPSADSLLDTVLAADPERLSLLAAAEHEHDPHRLGDIHTRLEAIGAYAAPARAAAILDGLGFASADQHRSCAEFSSGWRMRVALAAVLFAAPDLLLLDEPTNYLDLEGVMWLEEYLKRYRHSVLVVSHDRDLLNSVCEFILHLEQGKLTLYTGNYDTFSQTRAMRRANDLAFAKRQEAQRKHLQSFVDRFRYTASKARQAQSRIKMLERMEALDIPLDEQVAPIRLPEPEPASPPLLALDAVSIGYEPGRPVLSQIHLRLDPDDRIALLGKNGNGKSTLAKLLAGKIEPMGGTLARARKLVPGFFAQHQLEELDGTLTPVETLARLRPKLSEQQLRTQLGGFGFSAEKATTKVGALSGGERARLVLALATLDRPNLLILDEPTNHLDIDGRDSLLTALNDFEGAVILISHDRRLIESTADRLLLVADGRVTPFEGDLEEYRRHLLADASRPSEAASDTPKQSKEEARREAAQRRLQLKPLKDKADQEERQITALTAEISQYDRALADPKLFAQDPAKGNAIAKKRADAVTKLAAAEERWLNAQEAYEGALAER